MKPTPTNLSNRLKSTHKNTRVDIDEWYNKFNPGIQGRFKIFQKGALKYSAKRIADGSLHKRLVKMSGGKEEPFHLLVISCYAWVLSKYTGVNEFVLGAYDFLDSNSQPSMPISIAIDREQSFREFLLSLKEEYIEALRHKEFSIDLLLEKMGLESDREFFLAHYGLLDAGVKIPDGEEEVQPRFHAQQNEESIEFTFYFADHLNIDAERFLDHFIYLMTQATESPEKKYAEILLVDENEKRQLIELGNGPEVIYDKDHILGAWSSQVSHAPNAIALTGIDGEMSYEKLHQWSDHIGAYIHDKFQIEEGDVVAVLCDRGLWQIGAMFGILKAGASFIAIDPQLPQERIEYILSDSKAHLLIIHTANAFTWKDGQQWDIQDKPFEFSYSKTLPDRPENPKSGAYMVYTSGTTGNPKGTLIAHDAFMNMILDQISQMDITADDRILQFASASFDASIYEIFLALLAGACLVQTNREIIDQPRDFEKFIADNKVSFMLLPPVYLSQLNREKLQTVRHILVGGDYPIIDDLKELLSYGVRCFNAYGPSEAAVVVSSYAVSLTDEEPLPIGKPISNTSFYILDENQHILPSLVSGELYIGGANLGKGYHNRPELTTAKFVKNPYGQGNLYRTGDLAYWNKDGLVILRGRVDEQVKIRGYRIEPLGVQHKLNDIPGIRKSVVIADKDTTGANVIRAFYTAEEPIAASDLNDLLQRYLPKYMIPSSFMFIEKIPLTHAGKVNKRVLLQQWKEFESNRDVADFTPKNVTEADIYEVWCGVLGKKMEPHENFFNIGGDSIKAIQVVSRLLAKGYQINARDVFTNPTIYQLAEVIKEQKQMVVDEVIEGDIPLSPIQKVFLNARHPEPWHFNQAAVLKVKGNISVEALTSAFKTILNHHDALRIIFSEQASDYHQKNLPAPISFEIHQYGFEAEENPVGKVTKTVASNQATIKLDEAPLLRVDYYSLKGESHLSITAHHLIIDAVSWGILLADLDYLLKSKESPATSLPAKTTSWKQWCETLNQYMPKPISWAQKADTHIPHDQQGEENIVKNTKAATFTIDKELTLQLDQEVHHRYRTTVQDFLLAALTQTIFQVWDLPGITIDVETHGRQLMEDLDVSRTIGWFTCFYPFHLDKSDCSEAEQMIIQTKENLRQMQRHALDYMAGYDAIEPTEKPRILFNYLGTIGNTSFDSFEWSDIPTGPTQSPVMERSYDWEVNALITGGKLLVSITYCQGHFSSERMGSVTQKMKENLGGLVKALKSKTQPLLTPADLVKPEITLPELLELQRHHPAEDIYPLTPMQEGMFFHSLVDKEAGFYCTQLSYQMVGELDTTILGKAYSQLVGRHAGLRSCFVQDKKGKPWQIIRDHMVPEFEVEDISAMDPDQAERHIGHVKELDKQRGFDLDQDAPMRIRILTQGKDKNYFIWSYHHIIMDGWCMSILTAEWMKLYDSLLEKKPDNLPLVSPYRDYINWRYSKDIDASYTYWQQLLEGYAGVRDIPHTNRLTSSIDHTDRVNKQIVFDLEQSKSIKALASQFNVTLNVLVQGVWSIILSKYAHASDIVFGTVVSGRPGDLPGVESIVGLFINNIPVRAKMTEGQSFSSLLHQLQEQSIDSEQHQYCSLAEIQSRMPESVSLVDHIMLFENFPSVENIETAMGSGNGEVGFRIMEADAHDTNNYPFTLVIVPGDLIQMRINLNPQVHPEIVADHILSYFSEIFTRLATEGDQPITQLNKIPSSLSKELLENGDVPQADNELVSIPHLFGLTVSKYGERQAIVSSEGQLTYRQLHERSNRLAHILDKTYGVKRGDVVALHLDKSIPAFVGIWGILKVGAAYVPIDPSWPEERKAYVLKDAGVNVVVGLFDHLTELQGTECRVLAIDIQADDESFPTDDVEVTISPDDLAYIIYTSGSTGNPKGVPIQHQGNLNMALDQVRQFGITKEDHVLQFAPLYFDASIYEWSIACYSGACLFIPDGQVLKNPELFCSYLKENDISMATLPPSFFNMLPVDGTAWPRIVVQAGSSPNPQQTVAVSHFAQCYNAYGPTECSVCIAVHPVDQEDAQLAVLPIGRPVTGNTVYILGENMDLVPLGAEGEICVSGINVSPGYISQKQGQGEVFVSNPFVEGETLYRTGDMGRWLPDYQIEFTGRKDRQLKVRGYRIEPTEIETALKRLGYITQVAVGAVQDSSGLTLLVAYLVASKDWLEKDIRSKLQDYLPTYMIPDRFVEVSTMPLTQNGKIDHEALKNYSNQQQDTPGSTLPSNEVEQQLYDIWKEVLEKDDFGVGDKFFEVGGNSLLLIRVHSQVKTIYPQTSITDIFNYNTIEEMAAYITSVQSAERIEIAAGTPFKNFQRTGQGSANEVKSQSVEFTAFEWEGIMDKFQLTMPDCQNEDLLLSFFCFALYEEIGLPTINTVLLDKTAKRYVGLMPVNFDHVDSAEGLLKHIVKKRIDTAGDSPNSLENIMLCKEQDEIVTAFSHSYIPEATPVELQDIDILLKSETSKSGDLRISFHWKAAVIENKFAEEVKNRFTNVVRNLTLA